MVFRDKLASGMGEELTTGFELVQVNGSIALNIPCMVRGFLRISGASSSELTITITSMENHIININSIEVEQTWRSSPLLWNNVSRRLLIIRDDDGCSCGAHYSWCSCRSCICSRKKLEMRCTFNKKIRSPH